MPTPSIHDSAERVRLAQLLADTPQQFADIMVQLTPDVAYDDLPPISSELETDLWSFIDGLLTNEEEEELRIQLNTNAAGRAHLARLTRNRMAAEVANEVREARPSSGIAPGRRRETQVVVMLAKDSLRWGGSERHVETWRLSQARSGSNEAQTTLDEDRDTELGVIRLTIDLNPDSSCRVAFLLKQPKQPTDRLVVEWRTEDGSAIGSQTPQRDAVRFIRVPAGVHHFVFLADGVELERIVLDLRADR